MPFGSVKLTPGVNKKKTATLNEAGISEGQLIRFRQGLVQKMGGWVQFCGVVDDGGNGGPEPEPPAVPPTPLPELASLQAWNEMPAITIDGNDFLWVSPLFVPSSPVIIDKSFTVDPYYDEMAVAGDNSKYAFSYNGRVYFVRYRTNIGGFTLELHSFAEDDQSDHTTLDIEELLHTLYPAVGGRYTSVQSFAHDDVNGYLYLGHSWEGFGSNIAGITELHINNPSASRHKSFNIDITIAYTVSGLGLYGGYIYWCTIPDASAVAGVRKLQLADFDTVTTVYNYPDQDVYGNYGGVVAGTNLYFGPIATTNLVTIVDLTDDSVSTFDITTGNPGVLDGVIPYGLPYYGQRPYADATHLYVWGRKNSGGGHQDGLLLCRFKLLDNSPDGFFDFDDLLGAGETVDLVFNGTTDGTYHYVTMTIDVTVPPVQNSLRIARISQDLTTGEFYSLDTPPPANDAFADAVALTLNVSAAGNTYYTTHEVSEPDHAGAGGTASVWWTFTPSETATVFLNVGDEDALNSVAVYTGSTLGSLVEVVSTAVGGQVSFDAVSGTTYRIAVDDLVGGTSFYVTVASVPTNDDFANAATVILGEARAGHIRGATSEAGEPSHGSGDGEGMSIWWKFTPTVGGDYLIDMTESEENDAGWVIAVYTGTSVDALSEVVSATDWPLASLTFTALADVTYYIAFDAWAFDPGSFGGVYFTITAV